jgi:hypothetical protein
MDGYLVTDMVSKAGLRAVVVAERDREALIERIGVLQTKLDAVESARDEQVFGRQSEAKRLEDQAATIATLRQAERMGKVLYRDGTIAIALGGIIVGIASLVNIPIMRWVIAGTGTGVVVFALWICKMTQRNIWPPGTDDGGRSLSDNSKTEGQN